MLTIMLLCKGDKLKQIVADEIWILFRMMMCEWICLVVELLFDKNGNLLYDHVKSSNVRRLIQAKNIDHMGSGSVLESSFSKDSCYSNGLEDGTDTRSIFSFLKYKVLNLICFLCILNEKAH